MSEDKQVSEHVGRRFKLDSEVSNTLDNLSALTGLSVDSIVNRAIQSWALSESEAIATAIRNDAENRVQAFLHSLGE